MGGVGCCRDCIVIEYTLVVEWSHVQYVEVQLLWLVIVKTKSNNGTAS